MKFLSCFIQKYRRKDTVGDKLKEDRISQLPDDLICQILSHLPTKDVVRTSVLSTRWTSLWLWVPHVELDSRNFEYADLCSFVSFGDRIFDYNRASCINKLKLTVIDARVESASYLTSWIDALVKRKIQHLYLQCHPSSKCLCKIPISLYICDTLVYLKLEKVEWTSAEFVSLPCLKTMLLQENTFPNEATFKTLVSSCLVLEDLTIWVCENHTKVYRVHSRSLRNLTFRRFSHYEFDSVPELVIDAPLLCGLDIIDSVSEIIITNTLESISKLDISLYFGLEGFYETNLSLGRSRFSCFLSKISRVMDMKTSAVTFKALHHYSISESLPQFVYLSRLWVSFRGPDLKWLPTFLESCPNLKSLVLEYIGHTRDLCSEEMNQLNFSSVPECLQSSLEFVDFEFLIRGYAVELKLGKYFLENSAVLKKLSLRLFCHPRRNKIFKKFLRMPRGSDKCEVVLKI